MKKHLSQVLIATALTITGVLVLLLVINKGELFGAQILSSNSGDREGEGEQDPTSRRVRDSDSANKDLGVSNRTHPFPGIAKNRNNLGLDTDPFAPQSRAEQQWLDRNGYPNEEQMTAYSQASDHLLQEAADMGDGVANVLLSARKLARGDELAEKELLNAAADGSIFALTTLAGFEGRTGGLEGTIRSYAMTRVTEMLGDYKVGLTRDMITNRVLDPSQRLQAEGQALVLYKELIKLRRARKGPNAPIVDPRPIE